jgi:hypothetical protein
MLYLNFTPSQKGKIIQIFKPYFEIQLILLLLKSYYNYKFRNSRDFKIDPVNTVSDSQKLSRRNRNYSMLNKSS